MSGLIAFYRLLLRFYPRPFREEFGPEMEVVFEEQIADLASSGHFIQFQFFLHELFDWPFQCFQAHWQVRHQRLSASNGKPLSWRDSAASSLPFLLMALFLSGNILYFLYGGVGLFVSLILGYGFVFVLMLVITFAWWRGWPTWSITWLGFLCVALLVLFLPWFLFNILIQSPQLQQTQLLLTELGLPLLLFIALYAILYRWPRVGLAAMLPMFGMAWFLYLEFVPETISTSIMAATWIWLGIVALVILRWRRHAWDVWLLYLAAFVTGVIYIYAGHFLTEMQVRDGTLIRMSEDLISVLLPTLTPLVGLLLLHTLRLWSWRTSRLAVTSYRLILIAVLLTVVGIQTNLLLLRQGNLLAWQQGVGIWATAAVLMGFFLMVVGAGLIVKAWREGRITVGGPIWLLLGLIFLTPLMFDIPGLPTLYNQLTYQQLGPDQFAQQQIATRVLQMQQMSYLAGVVWLLLAGWVIGRVFRLVPQSSAEREAETDLAGAQYKSDVPMPKRSGRTTIREKLYLVAGLLILTSLLLPLTTLATLFPNNHAQPFDLQTSLPLFVVVTSALILAAVLLSSGFNLYQTSARKATAIFFVLSGLLLAKAMHSLYWLMVWDTTYDGLGYLWLFIPITGVFLATSWLAFALPKRARLAALLYLILIPPLMIVLSGRAQQVGFRQLTELRAERVSQALETYFAQEGAFPEMLGQLTPTYLLTLSEPVIIFGEDWCYDGGGVNYRFGYVSREHWSDPRLIGHVYSSKGEEASGATLFCDPEINALQAREPEYYQLRNEYENPVTDKGEGQLPSK